MEENDSRKILYELQNSPTVEQRREICDKLEEQIPIEQVAGIASLGFGVEIALLDVFLKQPITFAAVEYLLSTGLMLGVGSLFIQMQDKKEYISK